MTLSSLVKFETSSITLVAASLTAAVKPSSIMVLTEPEALFVTIEAMALRFWLT